MEVTFGSRSEMREFAFNIIILQEHETFSISFMFLENGRILCFEERSNNKFISNKQEKQVGSIFQLLMKLFACGQGRIETEYNFGVTPAEILDIFAEKSCEVLIFIVWNWNEFLLFVFLNYFFSLDTFLL